MWLTLENSIELGDLLGMSQAEGIEVLEELKASLLLGPHAMDKPNSMTSLSSCKLHSQKHWTCANLKPVCGHPALPWKVKNVAGCL